MEQERSEDSKAGSGSEASRYQSQVSKSKYADKSSEEASGNTETEEINLPKPDSASRIRTHVKKNLDEDERRPILRSRVEDNEPNPRGLKTKAKESQKDDGHPGSNEQNTNVENSEVTTGQKMGGVPVEDHENEESPASSVSRIRTHVKKNLDEDERRPSLGSRVEENEPNPRGLKARGKESQKDDGHQGSNEQHSKEENSEVTKAQKMGGVPVEDHENEESPASSVSRSRTHDKKNLDEDERRPSLRSRVEDNEANPRGLKARVKESQKDDDHQGSNEQNSNEGSSEVTKAQKIGGLPVEDHENEEYPASKKKTKGNRGPQKVLKPSKFRKPQRPLEPAQSGESNEAPEAQEAQKSGLPRIVNLPKPTREFYDERKWPDGVVRYVIKDTEDAAVDIGDVRKRLAEVTRLLEERTCVRLQELTEASAEKFEDYLVLDSSPDYVTGRVGGKQNFGVTELLLGGQHRQHAAMVVMAMLGFYFEVARHDRDKHIRVHMRNIRADKLHHFEKIRDDATFPLPYDYKSATHPAWQFWREIDKTGKSTVATFKKMDPDGSMMRSLGQNTPLLSDLDVVKINSVYGIECFKRKPKGRKLQQIKEKEGNFNNKEKIEEKHEELEKEVNGKESDEE